MPTRAECLEPERDTCTFYVNCLESRKPCGRSGYAVDFGERLCNRFLSKEGVLSASGQEWASDVRLCLQKDLTPILAQPSVSCEEIRSSAIAIHAPCYVKSGVCGLSPVDWIKVGYLLNTDLFTPGVGKQFFDTTSGCIGKYVDVFASVTLRFKELLEDVVERAQGLYQNHGYTTDPEMDHVASFFKEQVILPVLAESVEVDPSLIFVQDVFAGSTVVVVRILDAALTTSGSNSSNVTLELLSNSSIVASADTVGQLLVDALLTQYSSVGNLTLTSISFCAQGNNSCVESINGCQNVTCQNGGTCLQTENSSSCSCPFGYTGRSCEETASAAPSSTASVCEGVCLIAALLSASMFINWNML